MTKIWYKSTVLRGKKLGRKLGFPTVNLDPALWPSNLREGVYSSLVKYQNTIYKGALYYGPRLILGETARVLEIYILDFNQEIYDKNIEWKIVKFVREVRNFSSLTELKKQLKRDVIKVRKILHTPGVC